MFMYLPQCYVLVATHAPNNHKSKYTGAEAARNTSTHCATACDPGADPRRNRVRRPKTERQRCQTTPATGAARNPSARAWHIGWQACEASKLQWCPRNRDICHRGGSEENRSRSVARWNKKRRTQRMREHKRILDWIHMSLLSNQRPEHS